MRIKVCHRRIDALHTSDPGEIAKIMSEAEKIILPPNIMKTVADLSITIQNNAPYKGEDESAATIGLYALRFAYLLNQSGQLVEASPKPKGEQE